MNIFMPSDHKIYVMRSPISSTSYFDDTKSLQLVSRGHHLCEQLVPLQLPFQSSATHSTLRGSAMTRSKAKPKNQRKPWQEVAAEAQAYRDATLASIRPSLPEIPSPLPRNVLDIPRQILQPEEVRITEMLPEELLSTIAKGELTAVAVTTAFLRRAGVCQGLVGLFPQLRKSCNQLYTNIFP